MEQSLNATLMIIHRNEQRWNESSEFIFSFQNTFFGYTYKAPPFYFHIFSASYQLAALNKSQPCSIKSFHPPFTTINCFETMKNYSLENWKQIYFQAYVTNTSNIIIFLPLIHPANLPIHIDTKQWLHQRKKFNKLFNSMPKNKSFSQH